MAAMIAPMWPTDMINAPADTQAELPMLSLRHGQVARTLPRGLPPSQGLLDQPRYLQQLRVPLEREELGMGRGYRLRHRFDHRIELVVAQFSIRRGMALRGFAKFLVANRPQHRAAYRPAWTEQRAALSMTPGQERGTWVPILADEVLLHLHILIQTGPGPSKKSGSGMLPC